MMRGKEERLGCGEGERKDWCVMKGEDTLVIWRLITVSGLLS